MDTGIGGRRPMARRKTRARRAVALGAAVSGVGFGACTSVDPVAPDNSAPEAAIVVGSVPVPPERLTPFCQEMVALGDRLDTDPPPDIAAFVLERYRSVADQVPVAIADDFAAVVADLAGETIPSSVETTVPSTPAPTPAPVSGPVDSSAGDPFFDEGYGPGESPAERINAYVDFVCRATANNPGPPATAPGAAAPATS